MKLKNLEYALQRLYSETFDYNSMEQVRHELDNIHEILMNIKESEKTFTIAQGTTPTTYIKVEIGTHGIFIENDHVSTTQLLNIIKMRNKPKEK